MSTNKEFFKFLTILSLYDEIFLKCVFSFLYNAASFILIVAIFVYQSNLFWDFTNILTQLIILQDFKILHTVLLRFLLMLVMMAIAISVSQ